MAKTLIRNTIYDGVTKSFVAPADSTSALAFCQKALEGHYWVYEETSKTGNAEVAQANKVTITGRNKTNHQKVTFSFYAKANLNQNEIMTALKDKTFSGVKCDELYIIDMSVVDFGTSAGA